MSARTLLSPLAPALAPAGCVAERPADPVVLSGAGVPRLRGVAPAKVLAFRFLNGAWAQVPVEVDERAVVDLAKPKNAAPVGHPFLNYSPAATGMTYRHEFDGRGARIDGVPDSPTPGPITWESVDGPQGSLGVVHSFSTDIALNWTSYYLDKQNPGAGEETQCTGNGLVLRGERHEGHRIATQHRPHAGCGKSPGGHPQPVLRLARQGRRAAPQGPGREPAADDDG